jgi:hypothetical protein
MIYKTLHRTDNTMAKRKRTMIYKTLHRTDNTMAKRKRTNNDLQNTTQDRQYNGQKEKDKQ